MYKKHLEMFDGKIKLCAIGRCIVSTFPSLHLGPSSPFKHDEKHAYFKEMKYE